MDKELKAFKELDQEAEAQLQGMALSRYRIEAKRLFAAVGSDKAKPILAGFIKHWSKQWDALVKWNDGRALSEWEIDEARRRKFALG